MTITITTLSERYPSITVEYDASGEYAVAVAGAVHGIVSTRAIAESRGMVEAAIKALSNEQTSCVVSIPGELANIKVSRVAL